MEVAWVLALTALGCGARAPASVASYDGYCHTEAKGDAIHKLVVQVGACRFPAPPCRRSYAPPALTVTGFMTRSEVRIPDVEAPPALEKYTFFIPDKCRARGRQLAGTVLHACDTDAAPALLLAGSGAGYACLRRRGALLTAAHVYVYQYCL